MSIATFICRIAELHHGDINISIADAVIDSDMVNYYCIVSVVPIDEPRAIYGIDPAQAEYLARHFLATWFSGMKITDASGLSVDSSIMYSI